MSVKSLTTSLSSRRALLGAAIGAVAASVASAIGRPIPARAVTGDFYSTTSTPAVAALSSSTQGTGVVGTNNALTGLTRGVYGHSDSTQGIGVFGYASASSGVSHGVNGENWSSSGRGVGGHAAALSGTTFGVEGRSDSTSGTAIHGSAVASTGPTLGVFGRVSSPDGTAVLGYSGSGGDPAPVPKTGVYGYAAQDSNARGVWGGTLAGRGVYGQATSGQGVRGFSDTGAALYASTSGLKKGYALRAVGRVRLDNCAGIATILSGTGSIVVTPGVDLVATSAVTATLQGSAGATTTTVSRVIVDTALDRFTIHLTVAATADVKVAWHVFG